MSRLARNKQENATSAEMSFFGFLKWRKSSSRHFQTATSSPARHRTSSSVFWRYLNSEIRTIVPNLDQRTEVTAEIEPAGTLA